MIHRFIVVVIVVGLSAAVCASTASAQAPNCDSCLPDCTSCGQKVCVTTSKPGKETKHCWEVECDDVCIPAIRFPWESWGKSRCDSCDGCPAPKCGKVRRVRKLKKVEYECDVCKYEHSIECRGPSCGSGGDSTACDAGVPSDVWFAAPAAR